MATQATHSSHTRRSLGILGEMISAARKERAMSQGELARRIGVSRPTIVALEQGSPKVAIGTVFEAAVTVGIPLLAENTRELDRLAKSVAAIARVLPERGRGKTTPVHDDF